VYAIWAEVLPQECGVRRELSVWFGDVVCQPLLAHGFLS
jgi:hypothetical protein